MIAATPIRRALGAVALGAAVLVTAACARPRPCPVPVLAVERPFLWRVSGAGPGVVWLFGTVHAADQGDVPAPAWAALATASRFASELGDAEPDPDQLAELMVLPRGKGLDALLPADDWWDLSEALRDRVKPEQLRRARPWYAMSLLTAQVAPRGDAPTMDQALTRRAAARELPIDALESWRDQLTAVAGAVTVADLREAIAARDSMRCDLAVMRASYLAGATARMEAHLNVAGSSRLLAARDAAWLPQVEGYLAGDGAFVAVGLSHLLGPDGLPARLAARGYTVERVAPAPPISAR